MGNTERLAILEAEINTLKTELKTMLLDLREHYRESQNPYNSGYIKANAGSRTFTSVDKSKPN